MISLDDLLAHGGQVMGSPTARTFKDFSYDSRLTRPGELFLALQTSRADGHDYIPAALTAGATGVICSWPPRNPGNATVILADNPEDLVKRWAVHRLHQVAPTTIAVTGSVGKTSTKHAIAALLSAQSPTFASRQSFNALPGLPMALARLNDEHRYAVLEFGSDRFGEIEQLAGMFRPHIGVVTNVEHVYLKAFESLDGVAREHATLLESLPADGWAIVNADNPHVLAMRSQTSAKVLTYGQRPASMLRASDVRLSATATFFRLHIHEDNALALSPTSVDVTIPLPGIPAVSIALAAIGVALACAMPLHEILQLIAEVQPLEGRLRPLPTTSGATLLDDSFDSSLPAALAAMQTLAAIPARRRIVVLGNILERGADTLSDYSEIGTLAGSMADVLICKGDWASSIVQSARQVQRAHPLVPSIVYTATSTLNALPSDLGPGDVILVKGNAESRMEHIVAGLLDASRDPRETLVRQEPAWKTVRIGIPDRPASVRIDLDAIAYNVRRLRELAGVPVMAVVKGDAYGHGAIRVARAALSSSASALAVATLSEARMLRNADITAPILVLGYTPPWQAHEAIVLGVTCAIFEFDVARAFSDAAVAVRREAIVHVKVDTGMGRLGMSPEQVVPFLRAVASLPNLRIEGLYSHFATADSDDESFARIQLGRFQEVVDACTAAGLRPPIVHMANSAALLRFPAARFDMVRPGIACYGLSPSNETPLLDDMRPVLSFHTELAQVKSVSPGVSLSYGRTFVTQRPSLIATIPVGYADGFRRVPPWQSVLVRGQRVPVVGRVCMDYAIIDVTDIDGVKRGDPVVLIGQQGDERITVDEVANWLGTINYEVVSAILPRVPREVGE